MGDNSFAGGGKKVKKSRLVDDGLRSDPLLFVCRCCCRAKREDGEWLRIKKNGKNRLDETFSQGLCLDCAAKYFVDSYDSAEEKKYLDRKKPVACIN